jgi:Tol biopolymer transport system component
MPMYGFKVLRRHTVEGLKLDRFDLIVAGVAVILLAVMGGVVWSGDHVGIYIPDGGYAPVGVASGSEPVRIRFSDVMSQQSVEDHFRIEPEISGDLTWTSQTILLFTPRQPWLAGQAYTVTVERGARPAKRSATLQADFSWTFTVRLPRAVYLAPADGLVHNLYMADLQTGAVVQLTTSEDGIEEYAVSPNGSEIAFSQDNPDQTANIWVLNLSSHAARQVTNCIDARCYSPAWKPDGTQLAYQRDDLNTGLGAGVSASRVWVVDLATLRTQLLYADTQILGEGPSWSPTGERIAVFDPAVSGIRIHDYAAGSDAIIDSMEGIVGHWSPDGQTLVYPVLTQGALGADFYTTLEMTDLAAMTRIPITGPEGKAVDDAEGVWSPDGQQLLVTRRYLGDGYTPGKQIYLLNLETGEAQPVVVDPAYYHAGAQWDAAGQRIIFQRYPLQQPGARPGVWTYDLKTGELRQIADNALMPQWVP